MKPIKFKEQNVIYAEDQPEYLPLPAFKTKEGNVTCCWNLSLKERIKILFTGNLWLSVLTFNQPLQPLLPTVNKNEVIK
jgi:hypothetical protein